MTSNNINRLKSLTTISLVLIVLISFAYRSLRADKGIVGKRLPEKKEMLVKDAPINGSEINVPLRDSIVSFGMDLVGTPYVEAGCSRDGFDCSGFVYFVFQHFKIQVPRSSSQFDNFGKEIAIESVKKGDVLLFLSPTRNVIGHLGIVSNPKGMESDFIHATSGRDMKVIISSLKQRGYTRRFVKAIRVL
ncbi:C40 family peptidase [Flavobacterium frigoris]|uniref:Cell wall-associated hydrolase, NlpC family n=1 Tax=Flavobacterium frigoris TaxID=229204 RepID=A0A1H9IPS8_FLAFI|nr:C40 family peptidase [Flavobacterium frigoris]SEQ76519.1 Cell wall-associated hydrolase, NlpC family [Flavobacterium frigoris]